MQLETATKETFWKIMQLETATKETLWNILLQLWRKYKSKYYYYCLSLSQSKKGYPIKNVIYVAPHTHTHKHIFINVWLITE